MSRQRLLTDSQLQWLNDQLPDNSMRNGRIRPGRVMEWAEALNINVNTLRGYIRKTKNSHESIARSHGKAANGGDHDRPATPIAGGVI